MDTDDKILKQDGSKFKVMVVDDSGFIVKSLSRLLTKLGLEVIATASDGNEALEKTEKLKEQLDLITLDITMPKRDGISTLQVLSKKYPYIKVIMVSALGHEKMIMEAITNGAKHFIVKPFKKDDVKRILKFVLLGVK